MTTLQIGSKSFSIKFGYAATVRSGLMKRLASLGNTDNDLDAMNNILEVLPELLLVGLQKFHSADYGFDPKNSVSKEKALRKVDDLLDEYFDSDDSDLQVLFDALQTELIDNGFLSKLIRKKKATEIEALPEMKADQATTN